MSAFRLLADPPQVNLTASITASSSQNTLAAVQTTITPSGGTSYTYAGSLAKPTGSSAALDSATIANPTFTPDKAGVYTVTLTATDTASGATVTKVRTQEVGTAALSVSITAIGNNASRPTSGTEALACSASGAVGSVTYAWTVTDPSGASVTPADATAASTTIAYTPSQQPGQWTAVVTVTDATGRTARAAELWTTGGIPTATTARAILVYVTGGVASWKEQVEIGSEWVDVSGSSGTLATETDGGVTFAAATMTIPSGIATNTATQSCADERYMALSSASATLQALIATGATCSLQVAEDSMEQISNSRWGVAVVSTSGGAFDAAAENRVSTRIGWNGTAWQLAIQANTASFSSVGTAATMGTRSASFSCGQSAGYWYWDAGTTGGALTTGTALPDRIYLTGSATTGLPAADTDVVNPRARIIFRPIGSV